MKGLACYLIDAIEEVELELKYEYFGDVFDLEDLYDDDDDWYENEDERPLFE